MRERHADRAELEVRETGAESSVSEVNYALHFPTQRRIATKQEKVSDQRHALI